jgi:hypothetical protein
MTICRKPRKVADQGPERVRRGTDTVDALFGTAGANAGLYDPPAVGSNEQANQYMVLHLLSSKGTNGRPLEMYSRTGLELFLRCAVYEATCTHPALLQKLLLTFVVEVVVVGESNYHYRNPIIIIIIRCTV